MKVLFLSALVAILGISATSCSMMEAKSEEAIVLKVDTASVMKGRVIKGSIEIDNQEDNTHKTFKLEPVVE